MLGSYIETTLRVEVTLHSQLRLLALIASIPLIRSFSRKLFAIQIFATTGEEINLQFMNRNFSPAFLSSSGENRYHANLLCFRRSWTTFSSLSFRAYWFRTFCCRRIDDSSRIYVLHAYKSQAKRKDRRNEKNFELWWDGAGFLAASSRFVYHSFHSCWESETADNFL